MLSNDRYAIIDIGTHAIRAAVYEGNFLGGKEIYSNTFKSDIKDLLSLSTIRMNHHVYNIISYFLSVFEKMGVKDIRSIATEVLRDTNRAEEFINYIEEIYGIKIKILTGSEEAKIGGLGLIYGIPDAHGVLVDLGGGSLEITEICDQQVKDLYSFPLGVQKVKQYENLSVELIKEMISEKFNIKPYSNCYMIGGSFKKIASLYLNYTRYPLNILHRLKIRSSSFLWYISKLADVEKSNESKKDNLYYAILLARAIIELFEPEYIIISTYGLKEGVRFYYLPEEEKKKNVIYELINKNNFNSKNLETQSYVDLIKPMLINADYNFLSNIELSLFMLNNNLIDNLTKETIAEYVLTTDIPFSHSQRVILSLIFVILFNKPDSRTHFLSKKLLSKQDYNNARIIGNILKICYEIDGPLFTKPSFSIVLKDKLWQLSIERSLPKMIFTSACQNLKTAALIQKSGLNNTC